MASANRWVRGICAFGRAGARRLHGLPLALPAELLRRPDTSHAVLRARL
jgi:hypothetical protein